jgi:hypothetical protein
MLTLINLLKRRNTELEESPGTISTKGRGFLRTNASASQLLEDFWKAVEKILKLR